MTLPTSKILRANKSLVATANLKHMSPTYSNGQKQNINIVLHSHPSQHDLINNSNKETPAIYPNQEQIQTREINNNKAPCNSLLDNNENEENPYEGITIVDPANVVPTGIKTRDMTQVEQNMTEINSLIHEKDNAIKALSIIINMYQNNPLIINKYIVPEYDTLQELLKLLTDAENVDIQLADIECSCVSPEYQIIRRIYLTKDNEIYSIEGCPGVIKIFEDYKISLTLVVVNM